MLESDQRTLQNPLYDPRFEHDACGIGAVVDLRGRKSYRTGGGEIPVASLNYDEKTAFDGKKFYDFYAEANKKK